MRQAPSNVALRVLSTVRTLSELSAIDPAPLQDGASVFVSGVRAYYALVKTATEAPNGVEIVAASRGIGRWFRWNVGAPSAVNFIEQDTFYLHPDGFGAGSTATGDSVAQAITKKRLMEITGLGAIANDTTVHVLGDMEDDDPYAGPQSILPGGRLSFDGTQGATELFSGTVSQSSMLNDGTRRWIKVDGIDWTTAGTGGVSLLKKRVRVTSGARAGAIAWLSKVHEVETEQCYVGRVINLVSPFDDSITIEEGDLIVVESLPKLGPMHSKAMELDTDDRLSFRSLECNAPGSFGRLQVLTQAAWIGCSLTGWRHDLHGTAYGSRFEMQALAIRPSLAAFGCTFATTNEVRAWFGVLACFYSCEFLTRLRAQYALDAQFEQPVDFWDWKAAAVDLSQRSRVQGTAVARGSSSVAGSYGLKMAGGTSYVGVQPTVAGALTATKDFEVAGVDGTWAADYPVVDTAHDAFLVPATG